MSVSGRKQAERRQARLARLHEQSEFETITTHCSQCGIPFEIRWPKRGTLGPNDCGLKRYCPRCILLPGKPGQKWLCRCGRVNQGNCIRCPICKTDAAEGRRVTEAVLSKLDRDRQKTKPCPQCGDEIPAEDTCCTKCQMG